MEIRDILADNLKATRKRKGMSQEELAHHAEIDRTYISALERCVYGATIDVVDRLAKVLGVSAAQLLTARGKTEEKPRPAKPDGA